MKNIDITEAQLASVRNLTDFDLVMFLSELDDHGWEVARETLRLILAASLEKEPAEQ